MKLSKNPRNVKPNIEVTFVCLREIEMKGKGRERLGEKGETRSHRMETRTRSTAVPRSVCKVRTQDPEVKGLWNKESKRCKLCSGEESIVGILSVFYIQQ